MTYRAADISSPTVTSLSPGKRWALPIKCNARWLGAIEPTLDGQESRALGFHDCPVADALPDAHDRALPAHRSIRIRLEHFPRQHDAVFDQEPDATAQRDLDGADIGMRVLRDCPGTVPDEQLHLVRWPSAQHHAVDDHLAEYELRARIVKNAQVLERLAPEPAKEIDQRSELVHGAQVPIGA